MRAITTAYSRLWNADVVRALKPATDSGWMVPPATAVDDPRARPATSRTSFPADSFGLAVKAGDMIAPAGCYASDRDMFVFLVNPDRVHRPGRGGRLMRACSSGTAKWGPGPSRSRLSTWRRVREPHRLGGQGRPDLRIVHKGNNFQGIGHKLGRELRVLADANTTAERDMVGRARCYVLGKDRETTVEAVHGIKGLGLSQKVIEAAYSTAEEWEVHGQVPARRLGDSATG